ncbi:pimeloyl-ACP methyl ester carboxylesterase [Actinokineospora baliensis]|uniref:alpha/beta hydrolase n=1 Tax=Actinokineospora baliensis TaxID=547056 RepID=UPI00195CC9C8|nr:alpha/beta hydrolase [Actinokineospora baliensis]MBM7776152.1 pimeloyl-ACP methyl ester carboxylesterase [Actinokineospora baliensis]
MLKRSVAVLATATLAAMALPGIAAARGGVQVQWAQCPDDTVLQCAAIVVPLDHARPKGPTITLRATKLPAGDQRNKIGTLFINNGGPGGSAADFTPVAAQLLGAKVTARYDIVGVDPRGIGGSRNCVTDGCGSAPLTCSPTPGGPAEVAKPVEPFPATAEDVPGFLAYADYLRALCATGSNPVIRHMSTADTVRDLELIRQAVGDSAFSFYGLSYGSVVGATYAAMYPDRIRNLIVDSVVDPVQWSTGKGRDSRFLVTTRINSADGAWEALTSALAECDRVGPSRCAASGSARAKWTAVVERAKQGPLQTAEGPLTYPNLISLAHSALTIPEGYPLLMDLLQQLHQSGTARAAAAPSLSALKEVAAKTKAQQVRPAFEGVACGETNNPTDRDAATRSAAHANRTAPDFGPLWAWLSAVCGNWPAHSPGAFQGPWRVRTSAPLLIVNNTHDPSTPISGARALHRLMPNSALLPVSAYGHGAVGISCVGKTYEKYLLDGILPTGGCKADTPLFP